MGGAIYFNSSSQNSLSSSIGMGLSALNAARVAMQTLGHNIANVNTEGYSKQEAIFATRDPQISNIGAIGRGVDAVKIQAARDNFLEAQLALESAEMGSLNAKAELYDRIETIYNPVSSLGLDEAVNNLFGGFSDLSAHPENIAQKQ